jgi:hypothetical protein
MQRHRGTEFEKELKRLLAKLGEGLEKESEKETFSEELRAKARELTGLSAMQIPTDDPEEKACLLDYFTEEVLREGLGEALKKYYTEHGSYPDFSDPAKLSNMH